MCYLLVTSVPLACSHLRAAFFILLFLWPRGRRRRLDREMPSSMTTKVRCDSVVNASTVFTRGARFDWIPCRRRHYSPRTRTAVANASLNVYPVIIGVRKHPLFAVGFREGSDKKNRVIRVRRSKSILYWNRRRPSTTVHRVQSVRPLAAASAAPPPTWTECVCIQDGRILVRRPATVYQSIGI